MEQPSTGAQHLPGKDVGAIVDTSVNFSSFLQQPPAGGSPCSTSTTGLTPPGSPTHENQGTSKPEDNTANDAAIEWDPLAAMASETILSETLQFHLRTEMDQQPDIKMKLQEQQEMLETVRETLRAEIEAHIQTKEVLQEQEKMCEKVANYAFSTVDDIDRTRLQLQGVQNDLERLETASNAQRIAHNQTKLQLQKKQQEADDMCKRWRGAAYELGRFQRQGRASNQMTDAEIIEKAGSLRFNIRNFCLQFFGDDARCPYSDRDIFDFLNRHLQLSFPSYTAYLLSPSCRPSLVQAFLWSFLQSEVFGSFRWAPDYAALLVRGIQYLLGTSLQDRFSGAE
jgi:hypothetical protein